jgi:hypothetical protein
MALVTSVTPVKQFESQQRSLARSTSERCSMRLIARIRNARHAVPFPGKLSRQRKGSSETMRRGPHSRVAQWCNPLFRTLGLENNSIPVRCSDARRFR